MKIRKLIMLLSLSSSLMLPFTTTIGSSAQAAEINTSITSNIDLEYYKNSPYFNVTTNGDDFEIVLTQSGLLQYCKDNNLPLPEVSMLRAAGTTAIRGSVLSGTFKVYISKSDLNFIANRGAPAVGLILGGLPYFVVGSIITYVAPGNYSHGRVFVYQNYNYQYWYYQ